MATILQLTPQTGAAATQIPVDAGGYAGVLLSADNLATTETVTVYQALTPPGGTTTYTPAVNANGAAAVLTASLPSVALPGGLVYAFTKSATAAACGVYLSPIKSRRLVMSGGFGVGSLFVGGIKGVWYDPSDFTTMFQDSAGTTPVTATGQGVGLLNDKSGSGISQLQAVSGSRPVLNKDGSGNYYLDFSGGKSMASSATLDLSGTPKLTVWAGLYHNSGLTNQTVAKSGSIAADAGSWDFGIYTHTVIMYRRRSTAFGAKSGSTIITGSAAVASCMLDLTGANSAAVSPSLRVNGSQPTLAEYGTPDYGAGNFGNRVVNLGTGQGAFDGRMYGFIVRGAASTYAVIKQGEAWMAGKTAVTLPFEVWPTAFSDTNLTTNRGAYLETSSFARTCCITSATTVTVTAFASAWGTYPTFSEIGVVVNGVYNQSIQMPSNGTVATTITLPAGTNKLVEFVSGLQSKPSALIGTWVVSVTCASGIIQTSVSSANRMLVYGDSITVGANSTPPTNNGWFRAVRYAYAPNDSAMEAWGYRKLYDDCLDATHRTAFTATVAAYNPSVLWMAIGTNDYGLNAWSAAVFGVAYADLLDKLHAAMPSLVIYCQTPLLRVTETANGSGSTMGDYRTQISTAVGTRTGYCTLVDGTAFMTTASLDVDGIHPTTAGHALYASAVRTALGI